ncbi:hypothetical protein BG004_002531 [Podila humilis]|nr:hypothetical protein BG004_002531 [Podila humilis]
MDPSTAVAKLTYSAKGLSLPLHQDDTLVLGRGKKLDIMVQHKEYPFTVEIHRDNNSSSSIKDDQRPAEKKQKAAQGQDPAPVVLSKQALETIKDWKTIHSDTVRREEIVDRDLDDNDAGDGTSDESDIEDRLNRSIMRDLQEPAEDTSDISQESSMICEELSDLEPERVAVNEWVGTAGNNSGSGSSSGGGGLHRNYPVKRE